MLVVYYILSVVSVSLCVVVCCVPGVDVCDRPLCSV